MISLTAMEQSLLEALRQTALDSTGGDFACAEEVDTKALGLTKQQFGALLTTLAAKGAINVDVEYINGGLTGRGTRGTKVTQITFNN